MTIKIEKTDAGMIIIARDGLGYIIGRTPAMHHRSHLDLLKEFTAGKWETVRFQLEEEK